MLHMKYNIQTHSQIYIHGEIKVQGVGCKNIIQTVKYEGHSIMQRIKGHSISLHKQLAYSTLLRVYITALRCLFSSVKNDNNGQELVCESHLCSLIQNENNSESTCQT